MAAEGNQKVLFTIPGKQLGSGAVQYTWQGDGNYLAMVGTNRQTQLVDRYGQVVDDISLAAGGQVLTCDWDADGDTLALLQVNNSAVIVWNASTKMSTALETNTKDLCWLRWSRNGPELAVGSTKGNLVIHNPRTTRMVTLLGKHSKRISCGTWGKMNQLVLGSDDKTVSVSNNQGEPIGSPFSIKGDPSDIQTQPKPGRGSSSFFISVVVSNKTVHVLDGSDGGKPIELAFNTKYGAVVGHCWAATDKLAVAFQTGWVSIISMAAGSEGEFLLERQVSKQPVVSLAASMETSRVAVVADSSIHMFDTLEVRDVPEERIALPMIGKRCEWGADGSTLTASVSDGSIVHYLVSMPVVNAACGTIVAYMGSLREVVVRDIASSARKPLAIKIVMEPSFIAVGRQHVAMGTNNLCWFYACNAADNLVNEVEYMGTVEGVSMNSSRAAVRFNGCVQVHMIDKNADPDGQHTLKFPDGPDEQAISASVLTEHFLIYGAADGAIVYFSLEDRVRPNEYRHVAGIRALYANAAGTRLIVIDESLSGFLYNPVDSSMMEIVGFPRDCTAVFWDMQDPLIFAAVAPKQAITYRHVQESLRGQSVVAVGTTELASNAHPIVLLGGEFACQAPSGGVAFVPLATHSLLASRCAAQQAPDATQDGRGGFEQALKLGKLDVCYDLAARMDDPACWSALRAAAIEALDAPLALRVARGMRDAGTVLALEPLQTVEDRNLLSGQFALLLREFTLAQDLLISSSRPLAALEMRCDLRQWDQALRLAETLQPARIPHICMQYAEKLSAESEYSQALERYTQALESQVSAGGRTVRVQLSEEHCDACRAGMAKMFIKTGNTTKGMQIAEESGGQVCLDCGTILESVKQYSDAALMYEKAGSWEKAAGLYIKLKEFRAAAPLMAKISTPKLHVKYAEAKEKQKQYREAAESYEKGRDLDSVVRLCLEHLQTPQRAFQIVRETRSAKGAELVVAYATQQGDTRSAVEFLLVAKEKEKAMELAQAHDLMDSFALFLGEEGTTNEYGKVAQYYESKQQPEQAAEFYQKAGQHQRALKLFLKVGERCIDRAIEVAGAARNDVITRTLIGYLTGEEDGETKDENHIFKLYMALGNFKEAARTAVIIASHEQQHGNYKVAHKMLFDTYKDLDAQDIPVPRELEETLMLLHSYIIVKTLVKNGDHESGARMLVRVAKSISKFPEHIVPILTSTVITCQRAGLKKTSFEYASMLMRPEYRAQIAESYKKKIESIVRKPTKTEDEVPVSPCPYCAAASPATTLDCPGCKNRVPYCIVSGLRMVADDWSNCPSCRFPALHSRFIAHLEADSRCPMCENEVAPASVHLIRDPTENLNKAARMLSRGDEDESGS